MKNIKHPFAVLGSAALLAVSLTACSSAPTDASAEDFCAAVSTSNLGEMDGEDFEAMAESAAEWADRMNEVGTPEDIPEDARAGFEIMVDQVSGLDAAAIEDAMGSDADPIEGDLSDEDQEKVDAFSDYESETCS